VEAARSFANERKAVGGTNINDALEEALKMMRTSERPQQIVFMTDGQPTVGETDIAQILKSVRAANNARVGTTTPTDDIAREAADAKARLFVFGVGFDVNTRLLDTLAEDNRGSSDYVLPQEDIEQKVGSLYAKIAYPVLANPRVDWGGMNVYDVYPKRMPDLFRGTQTVVFGRYKGSNAARVQLIGTSRGREERVPGSGSFGERGQLNDTLPRLWAVRKVGYLLDDARREGRTLDKEVQDEIIKLSKRYGIVTPLTAGLITEDGAVPTVPRPLAAGGFPGARGRGSAADSLSSAQVPAMSAMPARGQLFATQSGAGAVAASKATGAMREARQVKDDANVRYIEGKAFFLKDGVWTDGDYDAAKSPKVVTVKAFSPEYIALLKDAKVAKWLSVGERIIIVLNDKTIKVEP
jgi:Ca-activated chloride channel family protein